MKKIFPSIIIVFIGIYTHVYSQDGELDSTFANNGIQQTVIGSNFDVINRVLQQDDGKILAIGSTYGTGLASDIAIARYHVDGTLDNSFGSAGIKTISIGPKIDDPFDAIMLDNGKILITGISSNGMNYDTYICKLLPDGSLDTSFNQSGYVTKNVASGNDFSTSIALQNDGKIVICGYTINASNYNVLVMRYDSTGSIDSTFGLNGIVTIDSTIDQGADVVIDSNNRILVVGNISNGSLDTDILLLRLNDDGSLDNSFGTNGLVITPVSSSYEQGKRLLITSQGKILVSGTSKQNNYDDWLLVQYQGSGVLDPSFGTNGIVTKDLRGHSEFLNDMILQPDNKIVVIGSSYDTSLTYPSTDVAIGRFHSTGIPDSSFGNNGIVITKQDTLFEHLNSVVLQDDGKILVGGNAQIQGGKSIFLAMRYLSGLSIDTTDTTGGSVGLSYEKNNPLQFNVFPNPAVQQTMITYMLDHESTVTIELLDIKGLPQLILEEHALISRGKHEVNFMIPGSLSSGVYLIKLMSDNEVFYRRLIILDK